MYALITGASSGIGKELAILLGKRGYNLILIARREDRLKQLKMRLEQVYKIKVVYSAIDLSIPNNCNKIYETYQNYKISILVNNAGFGKIGFSTDIPIETELEMIQTNITALHMLTRLFLQKMHAGYILNVASIAGFQPCPLLNTYSATKAYVLNFSTCLNEELKKQGSLVHVATLCPGPVSTEFDKVAGTNFSLPSITAKQCAHRALDGMFQGKLMIFPAFSTNVMHILSRWIPYSILLPLEYFMQTKKLL